MTDSRRSNAWRIAIVVLVGGGAVAATGFAVGRRWPIERLERFMNRQAPPLNGWTDFTTTDLPRYELARAVIGDTLFIFGGFWTADPKATARVDALDLMTGNWSRRNDMPVAITHANAVVVRDTVWIVGGFEGDHPGPTTARVWRWDRHRDRWSEGPPLPAPRGGGALVAAGDTLHYFGGWLPDRNSDSPDHWALTIGDSAWQSRAPLPEPRGHLSGASLGGKVYAIGGNEGHDPAPVDVRRVDRYDPATDTWSPVTPLPFSASHTEPSTIVYEGRIIVAGGRSLSDGKSNNDAMLSFDPTTERWSHIGSLPVPFLGGVIVALRKSLIAGLGATHGNAPDNHQFWRAPMHDTWFRADSLPVALGEVSGGIIDDVLYLVGDGSPFTLMYDPAAGAWRGVRSAATRSVRGHHHAAEVLGGRLWLFGGLGGRDAPGLVQVYDPQARRWFIGPPMPFAAGSSSSAVIGGRAYVVGGIVRDTTTAEGAVFDPVSGRWSSIAPMPRARNHAASATDGARLFVFGGRGAGSGAGNVVANGFDDVQIYDPATNRWAVSDGSPGSPASLPQARGGTGKAVYLNGEFWVIGGETLDGSGATGDDTYARVDVYDPRTNRWRSGPPLLVPRHGIYPVTYEGRIIVAGGGASAGHAVSNVVEVLWPQIPSNANNSFGVAQ